jgi:hypothetical protein
VVQDFKKRADFTEITDTVVNRGEELEAGDIVLKLLKVSARTSRCC